MIRADARAAVHGRAWDAEDVGRAGFDVAGFFERAAVRAEVEDGAGVRVGRRRVEGEVDSTKVGALVVVVGFKGSAAERGYLYRKLRSQ